MRVGDAFHDVEVQFPFVVRGEFLAVTGLDKVHDYVVVFEGLGEAQRRLLVLALVEDADRMAGCGVGSCAAGAGGLRDAGKGLDGDGWDGFLLHVFVERWVDFLV